MIQRLDEPLAEHLKSEAVDYFQFCFQWTNSILVRNFPLNALMRIWDTYICEGEKFSSLHVYVCSAFLCHFSKNIKSLSGQELILFLKNLPTKNWKEENIESLLSQAWVWKVQFDDAPHHLLTKLYRTN